MQLQKVFADTGRFERGRPALFWVSDRQLDAITPFFARSRGVARVDDRRIVSGIVHVLRWGLEWHNAPAEYGPPKTLYNRFVRWTRAGHFDRIFSHLMDDDAPERPVIEAAHLWTHGTACRLLAMGHFPLTAGGVGATATAAAAGDARES